VPQVSFDEGLTRLKDAWRAGDAVT